MICQDLVLKPLEIIDYFEPKYWFIENPQTGLLIADHEGCSCICFCQVPEFLNLRCDQCHGGC